MKLVLKGILIGFAIFAVGTIAYMLIALRGGNAGASD